MHSDAPTMSDAVDWALAERVAVRVSGREPFAERYHYALARAGLRRADRPGRGARRRRDRAASRWPARRGPGSPTAPGGSAPTSRRSSGCCDPCIDKLGDRHGRPTALSPLGPEVRRRRGRRAARLDVDPGARPVRPAGHRGREPRRPGPRLLRRSEHPRPSRSGSPSRPASSGCGWRCTRSPTAPSSPASRGCARTSSAWSSRRSTPSTPTPSGSSTRFGRVADAVRARARTRSPTAG